MIKVEKVGKNILYYDVVAIEYDVVEELEIAYNHAAELLNTIEGPYIRIFDASHVNVNFSQIVRGMASARTGTPGSAGDPRAITTLYVGPELRLVADSLSQEQYGRLQTSWFESFAAALVRAEMLMTEVASAA